MPLDPPIIDNRRFDDIVQEARTRIPHYTPEWTDLNDSDPGMALVHVFAWMSEILLFRMARVPALNYVKFLQLLGIELLPAEPARAEVYFPVSSGHPNPYVDVPERTQVAAESDEGQLILFETKRALVALTATLAALQSVDNSNNYTLLTEANEETDNPFLPFGELVNAGNAFLIGFDYDGEFPPDIEVNLSFVVPVTQETNTEGFYCGESTQQSSIRLNWEYWGGSSWHSVTLLRDETRAFARSGHIYLKSPPRGTWRKAEIGDVRMVEGENGQPVAQGTIEGVTNATLYWIRAILDEGTYENPPRLLTVRSNTVEVIQAETIENEVLGGTDGSVSQEFQLENSPVLHGTLELEIDEGIREPSEDDAPWIEVADFLGSGPESRHYVLNRTTGEIQFGDGERGRIPVGNVENPNANVIAASYRSGGGTIGNLPAGRLITLVTSVEGIDENGVTNLRPAFGARDEESTAEAQVRARRQLSSRNRAVTTEDFEELAKRAANVKRATALPLHHPKFPGVPVPGAVTVVVVPDSAGPRPTPNEDTLRAVCRCLDKRRLLTTEVHVVKPTYHPVEVRGEVVANSDADLGEVREALRQDLLDYFHPLKGGDDGLGWPFGGDIFFSKVYQRVFGVPGIERIKRLVFIVDGEEKEAFKDVQVPAGVLLCSTEHHVEVNYSFDS